MHGRRQRRAGRPGDLPCGRVPGAGGDGDVPVRPALPATVVIIQARHPPGPGLLYFPQRGMAASPFPETMRPARELRLVLRLKEQARHLADELALAAIAASCPPAIEVARCLARPAGFPRAPSGSAASRACLISSWALALTRASSARAAATASRVAAATLMRSAASLMRDHPRHPGTHPHQARPGTPGTGQHPKRREISASCGHTGCSPGYRPAVAPSPGHQEVDPSSRRGPAASQCRDRRAHRAARRREPRLGILADPRRVAPARSPGQRIHDPPGDPPPHRARHSATRR